MKINWGAGIAILYIGFVVMILVLVGMSASQKIDLVTNDYYGEELVFQTKIDKIKRANALPESLTWEVNQQGILIRYPGDGVSGKIRLYCPANDKNDRSFNIHSKNRAQFIQVSEIQEGRYRLQIDWKNGPQTFWNEDVILISYNDKK